MPTRVQECVVSRVITGKNNVREKHMFNAGLPSSKYIMALLLPATSVVECPG